MTWPANMDDLTAADVMHRHLTTLPPDATIADLRAYFATSGSRRLALIADDGAYVGAIDATLLPAGADDAARVAAYATSAPTIAPGAPATDAREQGMRAPSRRLPVVDSLGRLVGIVAITRTLDGFCGSLAED